MDDQIQAVPQEVEQAKRSLEEKQTRAMCVDFATRIKHVDADSVVSISQSIYEFVTGETK